jgi:hypothetical protein
MPVRTVAVPAGERAAGRLAAGRLAAAVAGLTEDGIVILGGAVAAATVRTLAARMEADTRAFSVNDGDLDFGTENTAIGVEGTPGERARQPQDFRGIRPPPFAPHLFREIVYNEPAITVSAAVLVDEGGAAILNSRDGC